MTGTATTPAPSLIQWAASTELCASVSPTLGLVSSHWFRCQDRSVSVCGCAGEGMVLVLRADPPADDADDDGGGVCIGAAGPGGAGRQVAEVDPGISVVLCNIKWIVGRVCGTLAPARGVKSASARSSPLARRRVLFSPLCEDVVMAFRSRLQVAADRGCVSFIDLDASFSGGHVVTRATVEVLSEFITLKDTTTGNEIGALSLWCPSNGHQYKTAEPIGAHHILVTTNSPCTDFQVYSTSNLTTPSLQGSCTWASAGIVPTGLIASTSHRKVGDTNSTEIEFALHDAETSFHVGDVSIPAPSSLWSL
ncbi:hypothetical protein Pelo_9416 [Pelomyxa schiedti]|nr:hypothetical protein Pelo_9416 [Pelomyxa schiedti]